MNPFKKLLIINLSIFGDLIPSDQELSKFKNFREDYEVFRLETLAKFTETITENIFNSLNIEDATENKISVMNI